VTAIFNRSKILLVFLALSLAGGANALGAASEVKPHEISGVVLKLSGHPLGSVPVRLLERDFGGPASLFFPMVLDRPIASATTDKHGRFVLSTTHWNPIKAHKVSVEGLTLQATKISGEDVTTGFVSIRVNRHDQNLVIYVPNDFVPPPPIHVEPSNKKKRD
jgi:hypothetical protein